MPDPRVIDITDLRAPELTRMQTMVLAATEKHPVALNRDAVLDAARHATGLDDFGALDFLPRLDVWMQAVNEDDNASPLARTNVFQLAVRCATTRLRLEDFIGRHPEVNDVVIKRPIVVAGTPRSGTTFMLELLSADPRLRSLHWWEALQPIPGPKDAPTELDPNPRRTRALANARSLEALLPLQRLMHEFSADHIAEDIDLHVLNFSSYMLEWTAYVPRWRDYYLAEDQRGSYAYAKRAMQVLSWLHGPTPLGVEMSAAYGAVGGDATTCFPMRAFVLTHRDPVGFAAVGDGDVAVYRAYVSASGPITPSRWSTGPTATSRMLGRLRTRSRCAAGGAHAGCVFSGLDPQSRPDSARNLSAGGLADQR